MCVVARTDGTQVPDPISCITDPKQGETGSGSLFNVAGNQGTTLVDHRPSDQGEGTMSEFVGLSDGSRTIEGHVEHVLVRSRGCASLLGVNEIDWFGAAGNYVEVHVGSRSYLLRRTMKDVERLLDPSRFHRIHRSTIVNTRRIKELQMRSGGDYDVILHEGVRLTLSRARRGKLLGFLGNDMRL